MYYIYKTTNHINGKQYIGQHKGSPTDAYLGSGTAILKAIDKYGKENFSKEILCYCDTREEADEKEKYWINYYDAVNNDNFYNMMEGGTSGDGWRACHKWMKEHPDEAQRIYKENIQRLRQWEKDNPEEVKKRAERFLTAGHKWMKEHPDEVQAHMKTMNIKKEEWQRSHPEEHAAQVARFIKAGSEANSQKIRCITTGEIFSSQCEAARHYNILQTNISKCLKGERKSAGKHPITGEKLRWERI